MHQKSDTKIGQLSRSLAAKPSTLLTKVGIFLESSFHWLSIEV